MPYSADVATFIEVLGPFYEYVAEDLNIVEGKVVNKAAANNNSDREISEALGRYDSYSGISKMKFFQDFIHYKTDVINDPLGQIVQPVAITILT